MKVDEMKRSALVLMAKRPFRDEERALSHELVHVVLWPRNLAATDLVEVGPGDSRERGPGEPMVFRSLERGVG